MDFDPTADPVRAIEDACCSQGSGDNLRRTCQQAQKSFSAPLMSFQRPTGQFDEPAFFTAAELRLRLFAGQTVRDFDAKKLPLSAKAREAIDAALLRADRIEFLKKHWFNHVGKERDCRNSFNGIMTRETYTKAASLAALKAALPPGKITLVGEQESKMARVVPHILREEILADRLKWAVIGFNKAAAIDTLEARQAAFKESIEAWKTSHPGMTAWEALHSWTEANLSPAYGIASDGSPKPWSIVYFASSAFPRLWLRSPIQAASEIDKTAGFPVLSPGYREAYRRLSIDETIQDPELRAAFTRRVVMATIQPASAFMNALRARLSIVERAGDRGSKNGPGYINGAAFSPRVLIALLNIWRVHYNFFNWRPFHPPTTTDGILKKEPGGENDAAMEHGPTRSLAVPGTDQRISVPKRRYVPKDRSTPAMRLGIVSPSRPRPV